jgi:hypothetical protein
VIKQEHPARLKDGVEPPERLLVLFPRAAEAEDAADDDRPVAARRLELVQRLLEQQRLEAFRPRALATAREHVS